MHSCRAHFHVGMNLFCVPTKEGNIEKALKLSAFAQRIKRKHLDNGRLQGWCQKFSDKGDNSPNEGAKNLLAGFYKY